MTGSTVSRLPVPRDPLSRSESGTLLDASEIERLDRVYLDAYAEALSRREVEPLARHLHLPKLPEILSLSIAAMVGQWLTGATMTPAPFPDDLRDPSGQRIAVKGTGPSSWITMTDTDRASDLLIWVDYRDRVLRGASVRVLALSDRIFLQRAPRRLTLTQLLAACSAHLAVADFEPLRG